MGLDKGDAGIPAGEGLANCAVDARQSFPLTSHLDVR